MTPFQESCLENQQEDKHITRSGILSFFPRHLAASSSRIRSMMAWWQLVVPSQSAPFNAAEWNAKLHNSTMSDFIIHSQLSGKWSPESRTSSTYSSRRLQWSNDPGCYFCFCSCSLLAVPGRPRPSLCKCLCSLLLAPECSCLFLLTSACSSLLRLAPACSSLLRLAPACFDLLRLAPACSDLLLPVCWKRTPQRKGSNQSESSPGVSIFRLLLRQLSCGESLRPSIRLHTSSTEKQLDDAINWLR